MLLPALALCQDRPSFDAASIKVNDLPEQSGSLNPNPEGLTAHNVSVKFRIQMAWQLQDYQISIPAAFRDSMDSPHYGIVARAALVVAKGGPKDLHDPAPGNSPHTEPGTVDPTGDDHVVADVFPEVQRQLGLRVEARTAPIDVLIVDHIDSLLPQTSPADLF